MNFLWRVFRFVFGLCLEKVSSRGFTSEDKFRCCLAKGRVHYEDAEFFIFLPSFDVKYVEFYYLNQIYFSQLLSNVA